MIADMGVKRVEFIDDIFNVKKKILLNSSEEPQEII